MTAPPVPPSGDTSSKNPLEDTVKQLREEATKRDALLLRLNNQFDEISKKLNAPPPAPPKAPGQEGREFLDKPRDMLREVMQEAVAPINAEIEQLKAERVINSLKSRYKNDPKLAKIWSTIEPMIDGALYSGKTVINENTVAATVSWALGQFYMNGGSVPADTPPPKTKDEIDTPPHLRPTGGNRLPNLDGTADPNAPKLRELSENEKILARKRGMTDAQWIAATELKPSEVIGHDYRPKPPKA